ncbi:MAG: hypothetical protein Q4B54_06800, partial [Coriobacteriales bacterium]|nr:hypothetical protein [Coriobacteriales bacterium]
GQPSTNQPEPGRSDTDQPPTNQPEPGTSDTGQPATNKSDTNKHSSSKDDDEPEDVKPSIADLVKLYCSQTAKDALSEEELEYLVDLVVNKLEPQAVNLLRDSFPAFDEAASNNEIGNENGLYIYYDKGDKDGNADHEATNSDVLASVLGRPTEIDGKKTYVYILNVNAAQTVVRDEDGNVVTDESGKATVAREGTVATDLQNTLVHEMFHAYMDDYNRTGMIGATSNDNLIIDLNNLTEEQMTQFLNTRYPQWFIEGTASAVENTYQYRKTTFDVLTAAATIPGTGTSFAANSKEAIFYNYLTGTYSDGTTVGFHLQFSLGGGQDANGNNISPATSRYVSGYLATMYLGNMAAASSAEIGSPIGTQDGKTTVSSEKIRLGLNSILERMHNGETLDQVIAGISKDASGNSLYTSTNDFEAKFISGEIGPQGGYMSDKASLEFMSTFLGYLDSVSTSNGSRANGSMLFDFDKDFTGPLDNSVNATTDVLAIADKNTAVESTVPNSEALAGGGKSQSGSKGQTTASTSEQLATAAKASNVLADDTANDKTSAVKTEANEDEDEADVTDSEVEAGEIEDETNVSDSAPTLTLVESTTTTTEENVTIDAELPQAAKEAEPNVAESTSETI